MSYACENVYFYHLFSNELYLLLIEKIYYTLRTFLSGDFVVTDIPNLKSRTEF